MRRTLGLLLLLAVRSSLAQDLPPELEALRSNPSALAAARAAAAAQEGEQAPPAEPAVPPEQSTVDAAALLGSGEAASSTQPMFGEQLFKSMGSAQTTAISFNPDYSLAIGDRVSLRMWGAFTYSAPQIIDPQGNVFIPNVGPVRLAGVHNGDLNEVVRAAVQQVYRNNVGVYASLDASQPVHVFVTGFVRAPGQYAGAAAESVLGFLTRAGGIDPERGSYIDVRLMRGGTVRASYDLYDFLLQGRLEAVQLQDGDTIVVGGRHNAVQVTGDVFNAFGFEFMGDRAPAADILKLAHVKPGATHVSITHKIGPRQFGEYHALNELDGVMLSAGDELAVVSDRTVATILVRVDGAIDSSRVLTLPYGSRLRDALELVHPTPQAQPEAVQLFRASVADRQKQLLETSLRSLETYALTAQSATSEEASLRGQEAQRIMRFIERARAVQPQGQVVLAGRDTAMDTLLANGDVLVIPERSSIVTVAGEVTVPSAIAYDERSDVEDYVRLAGGPTQHWRNARILLVRRDGSIVEDRHAAPEPGDEILVLPKVKTKNIEVVRGITQILYQMAIAARVVINL